MKKSMKCLSLVLALVTIILAMSVTTSAANHEPEITPLWDNTAIIICNVLFPDNNHGYAEANIMGHVTATHIEADVYVYRQEGSRWVYVTEKHAEIDDCTLTISCEFVPTNGTYYRADYTFTVTKNGVDETITKTKYKTFTEQ